MRESDSDPDSRETDRSGVERRPLLQSMGVAGAAGALSGMATGTASADTPSSWASGGDAYYQQLVDDLQNGLGLPAADFVYANNEADTWSTYNFGGSDFSTVEDLDVSGDGVPFSEASRVTLDGSASENFDVNLRADVQDEAVNQGDVLLGVAYLRAPNGDAELEYYARYAAEFSNEVDTGASPTLTEEWQRFYFPIEYSTGADAGNWWTEMWLAYGEQTVDIGGLSLLDFGTNADVEQLPSGPAGQIYGPYYQQLVDDVTGRGLPTPEFAHANTESGTRSAFFVQNNVGTTSAVDLSGESVPFSEATRFDITSEPGDSFDAQMRPETDDTSYRSVESGDVLLAAAYLRAQSDGASVQINARNGNASAFNSVTSPQQPSFGTEWQLFYFPIEFGAAADAPNWWVEFWTALQQQTVDIGGIAVMDYGGDVAVGDLPSGAVTLGGGDDGGSEWPDVSDPYYAWLVEELSTDGLPGGSFLVDDTESGTRDAFWGTTNSFGTTDSLDVSGDTVPFSSADRFDVTSAPSNPWDVQLRTGISGPSVPAVESGQVLLGVAYLRSPDGNGEVRFEARNSNSDAFNSVTGNARPSLGTEWQRYYFPIEINAAADSGGWSIQIQMGFSTGTVDVGGLALLDFGTDADVGSLPSGAADTDDYYGDLFADVMGMGLPAPDYVWANSEQGTLDSSDVFTENPAGTVLQGSPEADVPFSVATTFDITSEPSNNFSVQLRGDVPQDVSAGDVMLGVAYLRSSSDSPEAPFYALDSGEYSNRATGNASPSIAAEWERHYFPIQFQTATSGADERLYVQFQLGFKQQTVEIGGFALMDFDGAVAPGDLPSGVPGPAEFSEWPDVSDPYYATLVEDLKDRDLPAAGRFVYADNEPDTFEFYELMRPDADQPGSATQTGIGVGGDDVPFSEATRIDVTETPDNPYQFSFKATAPEPAVNSGDTLLGVVYLRTPDEESRTVNYKSTENGNISANYVTKSRPTVTGEWQRFYFPIEYSSDGAAGDWFTEIWVGQDVQTIDIGGLALLYFAEGVPVGQLPVWQESPTEGWEQDADQRIRDHRMAELSVEVTDEGGNPVPDADVEVTMQEHAFGFGNMVAADELENTEEGDPYRENRKELFNLGVLENAHKWRFWENDRETADNAVDWMNDLGWDVRGHVCLWASIDSYAVPNDVVEAMGVAWDAEDIEAGEPDPDYVERETKAHVEDIIDYYGTRIDEWEVFNELIPQPGFVEAINGGSLDGVNVNEAPVIAEWFETAEAVAPEGMTLAINDYNTLVGPNENRRNGYETQMQFLKDQNAGLDAVGMQCHFNQGSTLLPSEIVSILDRYAGNDVRLRVTEFDMADETWAEEDKADFFYWFLKTVFSHPAVDDFVVWGLIDTLHWRDDAPFYAEGWEEKPSLDVYRNLVFDEWWTDEVGTTNSSGIWSTMAFEGTHEVAISGDGVNQSTTVELTDDGATVEAQLIPPEENDAPIADAGGTQTASPGESVTLDASGSSDPEGQDLSYRWEQMFEDTTDDPSISLSGSGSARASFTAPDVDERTELDFRVYVEDPAGNESSDTTDVYVEPESTPTSTPTPTDSPTPSPTPTVTPSPTDTPSPTPTDTPTDSPTASPTDSPAASPTESPTASPTDSPTPTPTPFPPETTERPAEDEPAGTDDGTTTTTGPGMGVVSTVASIGGLAAVAKRYLGDGEE